MVAPWVASWVALALGGCGATPAQQQIDGGETIRKCAAAPICDGLLVRECRNGAVGDVIDDCTAEGACNQGRCMSPTCAAADRAPTIFQGCVFYTAQADNAASDATAPTSFLVANPGAEKATVTLEEVIAGGTWMAKDTITVPAGGAGRLSVADHGVVTNSFNLGDGLRLLSTRPITVAQIESDDNDQHATSSGGTMLLPTHLLGSHYLAMTYPQAGTGTAISAPGAPDGAGRILIVGTEPRTTVNVTLPASAPMAVTGLNVMGTGVPYQFMLGDGDVFQMWTGADGEDLSGTDINADQPIAVFSGNIVTTYGRTAPGVHSPDMAHEQMPPITTWSMKYIAASLPPQASTCDTLLGQSGASIWRLMAALPNTTVSIAVPDRAGPPPDGRTLDPGVPWEIVTTGDFVVTASGGPVLVTQGIDCEPSLSVAVSADQFLSDLTFAVLPWFDQVAAVARKQGEAVMLDGIPIPDAQFTPAGDVYEVARVSLPACPSSQEVCAHRLHGHFGVTVRGMDVLASYALTIPPWSVCPMDPTCVP